MDYKNSKIYTIRSPQTDKYYIGATTQPLSKRFHTHKQKLNCMSREIIGLGNAYIELLEEYPCDTKEQLNAREGVLQREHKANIVNRNISCRTVEEYEALPEVIEARQTNRQKPERKEKEKAYAKAYMINNENRERKNALARERRKLAKENLA